MEQTHAVSVPEDGALYQLETARQALATAKTLPALKGIRDKAEAISRYAKQQKYGLEIANDAVEIRLVAERRLGELLKEREKAKGAREPGTRRGSTPSHDVTASPALKDLGITPMQSSRWQQEAALPEDAFQTYITDTRAKGEELTSAAVRRQARPYLPQSKPRAQRWCIEDDVEALFDLWDRLWPHWHTPADKARICGMLRSFLADLADEPPPQERTA